jgi:hypothetical protein
MVLTVEAIAAAFAGAQLATDADYTVLSAASAPGNAHLALSRNGTASLLVPVARVASDTTRLTHGLALRGAPAVEFARGPERWREPAAVVECREPKLVRTFAAMVAALIARLDTNKKPSWETVAALFAEWERLLGRRHLLKGESELGLWGELWCIARSTRPADLLEGWRGPDAEHVDFFMDGLGLEVKAGRRAGVHIVSQAQVDGGFGDVSIVLMSLHVAADPIRGRSLAEAVRYVSERVANLALFEEKLAAVGYARDDEGAYGRRFAVLQAPALYKAEHVPRVRAADPGVSQIRYRVELPPEAALAGAEADATTSIFGLDPSTYEYPCA